MLAINQYSQPGYVPLYIDDEYVGLTGETYTVFEGKPSQPATGPTGKNGNCENKISSFSFFQLRIKQHAHLVKKP